MKFDTAFDLAACTLLVITLIFLRALAPEARLEHILAATMSLAYFFSAIASSKGWRLMKAPCIFFSVCAAAIVVYMYAEALL